MGNQPVSGPACESEPGRFLVNAALPENLRETAAAMLNELHEMRLDVILVPSVYPEVAERGGKIRVACSRNPWWYRQLCRAYQSNRARPRRRKHGDTSIKRHHVIRALGEMAGGDCKTEYAARLLPYVYRVYDLVSGVTETGFWASKAPIPWNIPGVDL